MYKITEKKLKISMKKSIDMIKAIDYDNDRYSKLSA